MARPHKCRLVGSEPMAQAFKPIGIPARELSVVELRLDELEALRLSDLDGLYHTEAAEEMGVSRATFGRLLETGRRKVADALLNGKMLTLNGGIVKMIRERTFLCNECDAQFKIPCGQPRPDTCPTCGSDAIHRDLAERGHGCNGNKGQEPHHHGQCGQRQGHGHGHGHGCQEGSTGAVAEAEK
ncbi:MAG: DUF134 domain-containing protein [Candidatus Hydrogenedentes bacterium]|nr:DUF134 domain-containing protein [Candidatus Hydrogenedentota bacterium]